MIKKLEVLLSERAAEIWTLTDRDASYFSVLNGDASSVKTLALPSASSHQDKASVEKRFDIGLIGSWTWKFNEEGLRWFFECVYPELSAEVSIHVAGKGAEWLNEKYSNVQYEGFVPDAQVFMAQARVVALPMLGGSGIQIKSLDALASGSAIVATPISMRGISFSSAMVRTAEHPKDFARSLSSEIKNQSTCQREDTAVIALEWFRVRKAKFLSDLANSIGYSVQARPAVEQQMSPLEVKA